MIERDDRILIQAIDLLSTTEANPVDPPVNTV
jgi:hypothetical protein